MANPNRPRQTDGRGQQSHHSQRALVTGGTSGIGLELAKIFASNGFDIIIVGRSGLDKAVKEITESGISPNVTAINADLTEPGAPARVVQAALAGGPIDVLVNNAGEGTWGDFARETELDRELHIIDLNAKTVVELTKLVLKGMLKRKSGKLLFTASIASLSPTPLLNVYAATKAFVYSFALGLRDELKDTPITVTALCPGSTDTKFFERAGMENSETVKGSLADPHDVALAGYKALMNGDDHVVYPFKDRVMATITKILPDRIAAQQSRVQ